MATTFGLLSRLPLTFRQLSFANAVPALLHRSVESSAGGRRYTSNAASDFFAPLDVFSDRHIGPNREETSMMLSKLGYPCMEDFVRDTVPPAIRVSSHVISDDTIAPLSERELFQRAKILGKGNKVMRSYIGMGYHNAVVPPVVLRNVSVTSRNLLSSVLNSSRSSKILHGILNIRHISLR
jgi:Glycine cleavage system P-protein